MKVSYLSISGVTSLQSAALTRVRASRASPGDRKVLRVGGRSIVMGTSPPSSREKESKDERAGTRGVLLQHLSAGHHSYLYIRAPQSNTTWHQS